MPAGFDTARGDDCVRRGCGTFARCRRGVASLHPKVCPESLILLPSSTDAAGNLFKVHTCPALGPGLAPRSCGIFVWPPLRSQAVGRIGRRARMSCRRCAAIGHGRYGSALARRLFEELGPPGSQRLPLRSRPLSATLLASRAFAAARAPDPLAVVWCLMHTQTLCL